MRIARTVLAAALIATVAGCTSNDEPKEASGSGTAASTASGASDPPLPGGDAVPETGECWQVGPDDLAEGATAVSSDAAAVDCSQAHDSITIAVVAVPSAQESSIDALAQGGEAVTESDTDKWQQLVLPVCAAAYDKAYSSGAIAINSKWGDSAHKATVLRPRVWLPTAEEWLAGGRWVRCDLASNVGEPITVTDPKPDLSTVPPELASCLNANSEGFLVVSCDDPLANAQALVTVYREGSLDPSGQGGAFTEDAALMACQSAMEKGFPNVTKEVKAVLPIPQAYAGHFDCYVDRAPGDPLIG